MSAATPAPAAPRPPAHPPTLPVPRTMAPQHYGRTGKAAGMPTQKQAEDKKPSVNKGRIGAYMTPEEASRVRAAYQNGWLQDNSGSFSDFLKSVIIEAVDKLEREKNNGNEWPPVTAGAVRVVTHQQIADKRRAAAED
ncbi:Uncharacterised protein [Nocardia africana]|uniref:Uncharacterized protein n=2 Tax=Nocardia TaxID=1817 RepID=A0A379X5K4_9NOCA|nr:Uncharacterised protein [Nocardia africana]